MLFGQEAEHEWLMEQHLEKLKELETREKQLDALETQKNAWFANQRESIETLRSHYNGQIKLFMERHDIKTLRLPTATVSKVVRETRSWPEDAALIEWAKGQPHALNNLYSAKVLEKPNKLNILAKIKETGEAPIGFSIGSEESLTIRFN